MSVTNIYRTSVYDRFYWFAYVFHINLELRSAALHHMLFLAVGILWVGNYYSYPCFLGGETAFPAADNATYSESAFRTWGDGGEKTAKDLFNLSEHCGDSNVVVLPKKGTVVLWYNHLVDPKSGWMGALDEWSLHGGCDVIKGEKWIANLWVTAPYAETRDDVSMYHMDYLPIMEEEKKKWAYGSYQ